jgi:hypothetical protein
MFCLDSAWTKFCPARGIPSKLHGTPASCARDLDKGELKRSFRRDPFEKELPGLSACAIHARRGPPDPRDGRQNREGWRVRVRAHERNSSTGSMLAPSSWPARRTACCRTSSLLSRTALPLSSLLPTKHSDVKHPLDAFGYLVSAQERGRCTFVGSKWPNHTRSTLH